MKPLMFRRLALVLGLSVFLPVAGVAHEGVKCSERDLEQAIRVLGSGKAAKTYFTPFVTLTKKDVYWGRSEYRNVGLTDSQSRFDTYGKTLWNGVEMTLMYHEPAQALWVTMQPKPNGAAIPTVVYTKCAMLD